MTKLQLAIPFYWWKHRRDYSIGIWILFTGIDSIILTAAVVLILAVLS